MGADVIVAEEQSITGSIGVVTAKFNAKKLFEKVGYNVERISRGRFAEVCMHCHLFHTCKSIDVM